MQNPFMRALVASFRSWNLGGGHVCAFIEFGNKGLYSSCCCHAHVPAGGKGMLAHLETHLWASGKQPVMFCSGSIRVGASSNASLGGATGVAWCILAFVTGGMCFVGTFGGQMVLLGGNPTLHVP